MLLALSAVVSGVVAQDSKTTPEGFESIASAKTEIEALPFDELPLYKVVGLRRYGILNFRQAPKTGARILQQIPENFRALPIIELSGEWALVRYCNQEGWVSRNFLKLQTKDEDRIQPCDKGPVDPFPKTKILDEVAAITLDASEIQGDIDALDVLESDRDLGQATLSPAYALCISDAKRNNDKLSECLIDENIRWEDDMNIAFNLIAATLPFENMKKLRDAQRLWQESLEDLCDVEGLEDAEPFTRYHIPTCHLKLTFQRAIALEGLLQNDDDSDFDTRLSKLAPKTESK